MKEDEDFRRPFGNSGRIVQFLICGFVASGVRDKERKTLCFEFNAQ